ncbi:MAG: HAD hydrolase-like protein, partial [Verrucomicrobiota bacterium]|nr:HAD hydrolase-like protein [Verrucomicrobiota bacterium]
ERQEQGRQRLETSIRAGQKEVRQLIRRLRDDQADGETARKVSRYAGFAKYIPICIGSADTQWQKPELALTQHVLDHIEVSAEGSIIIGDSPTDIEVAQNAGLDCYCVSTGAHSLEELMEAGADAAFESLIELGQAIELSSL